MIDAVVEYRVCGDVEEMCPLIDMVLQECDQAPGLHGWMGMVKGVEGYGE